MCEVIVLLQKNNYCQHQNQNIVGKNQRNGGTK